MQITELRDWRVRLPFTNPTGDRPDFDLVVRIPAADEQTAAVLAEPIARHAAAATGATVGDLAALIPQEIDDDEPSIDVLRHLLATRDQEIRYWRGVMAALAGKYPLLLQLSQDEFDTADPDDIAAMAGPDGLVFVVPSAFGAAMDARGADQEPQLLPGHEPVTAGDLRHHRGRQLRMGSLWYGIADVVDAGGDQVGVVVPDGRTFPFARADTVAVRDSQPALAGDEDDPDVRRIRAGRLVGHGYGPLLVLDQGQWRLLERAAVDRLVVTLELAGKIRLGVGRDALVTVRPRSWTVDGAQLATRGAVGRQVLVDGRWCTVTEGARSLGRDGWFVIGVVGRDGFACEGDDQFQVRDVPTGWS